MAMDLLSLPQTQPRAYHLFDPPPLFDQIREPIRQALLVPPLGYRPQLPSSRFDEPSSQSSQFVDKPEQPATLPTGLRTMEECFMRSKKIGEGSAGVVYRGRNKATGELVALKKILMDNEMSKLEVEYLSTFPHPTIIELKEVMVSRDGTYIYLVMELAQGGDLSSLACDYERLEEVLDEDRVRELMRQMLEGVAHLHRSGVIHGDIKTDNLLLTAPEGRLKICDFSHSKRCLFDDAYRVGKYSQPLGSRWYLAPELLTAGEDATSWRYSAAIDMWAAGCVMGELLCREPLFMGVSTVADQYSKIVDLLGPNQEPPCFDRLRQKIPPETLTSDGFDLLTKLLDCNFLRRITAEEAIQHPWFH